MTALKRFLPIRFLGSLRVPALRELGWYRSYMRRASVDREGGHLPWYTYGSIRFLESRLQPHFRVFEYGCGNSTHWYAARVKEVVAVEHDEAWAHRVARAAGANVTVMHEPEREGYVKTLEGRGPFHVVAVDGRFRVDCGAFIAKELEPDGVVVWDNSDRPDFEGATPLVADQGFRVLRFAGMGPVSRTTWETAILYREGNCLGI